MQQKPPELGYVWSNVRVAEQVTINVLTWCALGILAAVVAGLGILAQWFAHYIIVPTHILLVIVWVGIGITLTLGILFGAFYLYLQTHPELSVGIFAGVLAAVLYASWRSGDLPKTMRQAMEKAAASMAQSEAQSSAQREPDK